MRLLISLILCQLLVGTNLRAAEDNYVLYVENQPYHKAVYVREKVLYAAVEDLFPLINLKIKTQNKILYASSRGYKNSILPQKKIDTCLYINGQPMMHGILIHEGRVWISLPVLAKTIGYNYTLNRDTGIADLFILVPGFPTSQGNKPASSKKKETKDSDANPLKVQVVNWFHPLYSTAMTHGIANTDMYFTFKITNTTDKEIKNVKATLQYLNGNGGPANNMRGTTYYIGAMQPGAAVTEDDHNNNNTLVVITPHVKLEWEGKDEKTQSWESSF